MVTGTLYLINLNQPIATMEAINLAGEIIYFCTCYVLCSCILITCVATFAEYDCKSLLCSFLVHVVFWLVRAVLFFFQGCVCFSLWTTLCYVWVCIVVFLKSQASWLHSQPSPLPSRRPPAKKHKNVMFATLCIPPGASPDSFAFIETEVASTQLLPQIDP